MKTAYLLFLLSAPALFATGCSKHEPEPGTAGNLPPVHVQLVPVVAEELPTRTEVTGTVRPVRRATIAAKVMGTIDALPLTLGQRVKTGETLVHIAAAEIEARVGQAKAQLSQAQRDLARERSLLAQNASTPDVVKGLEDRVAMTQAMVNEAEAMLGYTTVRAPFDGVVARKTADAGDLAAPGMPLIEIEGTDAFEVETGIPDSLAVGLSIGDELVVHVPASGVSFTGELTELSSAADTHARTVAARIAVPPAVAVQSGQFVRVQIPGPPIRAVLVPATAVTTLGQMDRVFVAYGGRAVLRLVKPGARHGERVEILSGLNAGERVVADPPSTLREGSPLKITEIAP